MDDMCQRLLEFTEDGIYRCTSQDGRILFANKGLVKILGLNCAPEDLIGKRFKELVELVDDSTIIETHQRKGAARNFHFWFKTAIGEVRWVKMDSYMVGDEKSGEKVIEGIVSDITNERRAEESVAAEREWLAVTLRCIGDAVIATDAAGRVVLMNGMAEQLTGWTEADARMRPLSQVFQIVDEITRQPAENPVQRVLANGKSIELANHVALVSRNSIERSIADTGAPILDKAGRLIGVVLVFRDVTHQRRTQAALRQSEENFRLLFEQMMSGFALHEIICDNAGQPVDYRYITVNPAFERLTGLSRDMVIGRTILEILPDIEKNWITRYGQVALTGKSIFIEDFAAPLGRYYEALAYCPKPGLFAVVFNDVTNRRQAEAELAKNNRLEALGVLAGGVAHDFNNILTSILGSVSLAKIYNRSEQPEMLSLLEEVEKASLRAKDLTHQLLTFSKGGAPIRQAADVKDMIRETAVFAISGSAVRCEIDIAPDLLPAEVDLGQISQVIQNLVVNAEQAMPEGGSVMVRAVNVELDADEAPPLKSGKYLQIEVEDTGIGIPGKHVDRIFDPYFTTKQKGTGLGLAIVYSIVNHHGGLIKVQSEVGRGSKFTLYLPASAKVVVTQAPEVDELYVQKGARVLLVDDDAGIRFVASRILSHYGYNVTTSEDGIQALQLYEHALKEGKPHHVVILDLTIPGGLGGRDALLALKGIDNDVKAIASSGYSNDPVMSDYAAFGFAGAVSKPYVTSQLIQTVTKVLQAKQ